MATTYDSIPTEIKNIDYNHFMKKFQVNAFNIMFRISMMLDVWMGDMTCKIIYKHYT